MLRIYLNTGLVSSKSIEVEGTLQDDILQLIDNYYLEHKSLPVPMYELGELEILVGQENLDMELEQMIPINGGEFWIYGISFIEEI